MKSLKFFTMIWILIMGAASSVGIASIVRFCFPDLTSLSFGILIAILFFVLWRGTAKLLDKMMAEVEAEMNERFIQHEKERREAAGLPT
jgi:uncharacterized membrane protein YkvI